MWGSEEEEELQHTGQIEATYDMMSPTTKPAQEEETVTDGSPSETSNPPSKDKDHKENKEDKLDWKKNL
eukprot:5851039-Ditylum_brightwellii.AAC.1